MLKAFKLFTSELYETEYKYCLYAYILTLPLCMSQTGVVQVNRPLDRERVAEYRLTITVKDNPENPRISRKVISVSVQYVCSHISKEQGSHQQHSNKKFKKKVKSIK